MNSFEKHGIRHLSPSSLNRWRAEPALWCLSYLGKFWDEAGASAWRGSAVEAGLEHWLRKRDSEAAKLHAMAAFESNAGGLCDDDTQAERENVPAMLAVAIESMGEPPELLATQLRIECMLDGIPVPVCGYVDFAFDGFDLDLKTTKACPSTPKPDHARQVALYRYARNREGGLHYVTGKKHARYMISDEEVEQHIAAMRRDALALQNFLARHETASDAIRSLPCNTDGWLWNDRSIRALSDMWEAA